MADATALWISGHLAEKIRAHGAETYPHECCGALLGRDLSSVAGSDRGSGAEAPAREILQLFPLGNRRDDSPRNRFSVTPEDVLAAEKAASEQGVEVVGWYDSHRGHTAVPSLYDSGYARPWSSSLLVGIQVSAPQDINSWILSG